MNKVFDFERELKRDLQRIERAPAHWTETRIQNNEGGILADVRRMQEENWWRRPSTSAAAAINQILSKYERARDGQEEPTTNERRTRERASPGGAGVENEWGDDQQDPDLIGDVASVEVLMPTAEESIGDWCARLGKAVDFNGRKKLFWDTLRSYASRFRGDVSAKKNLDAKLVQQFLKNVGGQNEQ